MDSPILWSLISIQVAMGAFDTIIHHEGTERLAWRPSQKKELRLHGVRNFFYAVIFLSFAWIEPHGVWTMILGAILVIEVVITLWDFVEEDMTRKLPWTERINHTLLALNYGAILALAAPLLWGWAKMPSALIPTTYGWWSVFATLSAAGVGLFSARDLLAASRSSRLDRGDPAKLVQDLAPRQNIFVTGGTGFIGQRLVQALVAGGHNVTVLTRDLRNVDVLTHPVRVINDLKLIQNTDRFDAIINLAGEGVASGLWTRKKRYNIIQSRVKMTRNLDALVARLDQKPKVFINGSAVGFYGLHDDAILAEDGIPNPAFIHDVCRAWEDAAAPIACHGVRLVVLRIGLVMGVSGGMLAKLLTPFEFGAGGQMGDGQQWMPWIEHDDLIRVISFAIANETLAGPVNATAPIPVRNADFTVALAAALGRPALFRFPAWMLHLLGDLGHETMLGGQRAVPVKLREHGFEFKHDTLGPMLQDITGAAGKNRQRHSASAIAVER